MSDPCGLFGAGRVGANGGRERATGRAGGGQLVCGLSCVAEAPDLWCVVVGHSGGGVLCVLRQNGSAGS